MLLWAFPNNLQRIVEIHFLNPFRMFMEIINAMFLDIQEIKAFHIMVSVVAEFYGRHQSVAGTFRAFKTKSDILTFRALIYAALLSSQRRRWTVPVIFPASFAWQDFFRNAFFDQRFHDAGIIR